MVGRRTNALRAYHLLIKREDSGFEWQIRYDRHANPVQRSETPFPTHADAMNAGEQALAALKREMAAEASQGDPQSTVSP